MSRNCGYKMANSINVRNEYQRKAIGLLESLVGKFTMWQVWQDIDQLAGKMCYIQLSLLGCAGYVVIQDTLSNPVICQDDKYLLPKDNGNIWYTPMYYTDIWTGRKLMASCRAAKLGRGS